MKSADGFFEGMGGLRLYYRAWELPRARAAIALVHGLGEHSGRYEPVADRLSAYGYSVFALDLRGHGLSEGRRGHVRRFDAYLQDLDRFRRELYGLVDVGTPLFLLGHSMGGLIALRYIEEFDTPFRGAIIVSPWLATAQPPPSWKLALARTLDRVAPAYPFSSGLDPALLSRDPVVVNGYRDDVLVHSRITPRLYSEAAAAMDLAVQRSERIHLPVMFLLAGNDRIVSTPKAHAFARSLAGHHITTHVYAEYFHEVLREPGNGEPLRDLRDWVAGRLARPRARRGLVG